MNVMNLQQNIDLFLSVATTTPVDGKERGLLFDFFSVENPEVQRYMVYKDDQSYFFENDKLVNCDRCLPVKNINMAYRFDGHSITMQELPESLSFFGGGSNRPPRRGGGSGGGTSTNNNNNNNNNNS